MLELAIYEAANDDQGRLGRGWQLLSDALGPFLQGGDLGPRRGEGKSHSPLATEWWAWWMAGFGLG